MNLSLVTVAWGTTGELGGIISISFEAYRIFCFDQADAVFPCAEDAGRPEGPARYRPGHATGILHMSSVTPGHAAGRIPWRCTASAFCTPSCLPPGIPSQPQPRHPHVPLSARDKHRLASSPPQHKKLLLFAAVTMETLGSGLRLFYLRCSRMHASPQIYNQRMAKHQMRLTAQVSLACHLVGWRPAPATTPLSPHVMPDATAAGRDT